MTRDELVVEWLGPATRLIGRKAEARRARRSRKFTNDHQAAHWVSALILDGRCQDIRLTGLRVGAGQT